MTPRFSDTSHPFPWIPGTFYRLFIPPTFCSTTASLLLFPLWAIPTLFPPPPQLQSEEPWMCCMCNSCLCRAFSLPLICYVVRCRALCAKDTAQKLIAPGRSPLCAKKSAFWPLQYGFPFTAWWCYWSQQFFTVLQEGPVQPASSKSATSSEESDYSRDQF